MLDIKHPDARRAGHQGHGQLHHQVSLPAKKPAACRHHGRHAQIHPHHRRAVLAFGPGGGKTLVNPEQPQRRDDKQNEGVPRQAVGDFFPARSLQILPHRQRPDVTLAAAVQVARGGMVDVVLPAPVAVGGEGQHPGEKAQNVIGAFRFEKGAVAAVMKNDEHTHQQQPRQRGDAERQPVGDGKAQPHEIPEREVGHERVDHLPEGARHRGRRIFGDDGFPFRNAGLGFHCGDRLGAGHQGWDGRIETGSQTNDLTRLSFHAQFGKQVSFSAPLPGGAGPKSRLDQAAAAILSPPNRSPCR